MVRLWSRIGWLSAVSEGLRGAKDWPQSFGASDWKEKVVVQHLPR